MLKTQTMLDFHEKIAPVLFSVKTSADLKLSKIQLEEVVEVQRPQNAYQFTFG